MAALTAALAADALKAAGACLDLMHRVLHGPALIIISPGALPHSLGKAVNAPAA